MQAANKRLYWPPDPAAEFRRRKALINGFCYRMTAQERHNTNVYYQNDPIAWIEDWCVTYNPRLAGMKTVPFRLFPRQRDFVLFLQACVQDKESGLVEKSRDIGATWLCAAFSIWLWLYQGGVSIGWGSRKEMLVDRLGDPDSIFEKMRMIINNLPIFMLPQGFIPAKHMTYMKFINPNNGSTITGEAGDNIGRGGRKTIFFKDESAHYEHPEPIEAALADNTDVQIDISSVCGTGNIFYKRRQAGEIWHKGKPTEKGKTRIFVFDWRDHPAKTQKWYDQRRAKAESEGLLHLFAQEVDRDYSASLEGIIIPAKWAQACIDSHIKLGFPAGGERLAALDVADEGGDKNALTMREGVVLRHAEHWGEGDAGESARRSIQSCAIFGAKEFYYDALGVGAAVKAETNRLAADELIPRHLRIMPWIASASPLNPDDYLIEGDMDTPIIRDLFPNLKSQAWWNLRTRCEKTYKSITQGIKYPHDDLISFDSALPELHQLMNELSQVQKAKRTDGKFAVDKKPKGTRSPNLADSAVMLYHPTREISILDVL